MTDEASDPLILTAAFDPASTACIQRLRDQHFPPRLNIVPAHLTLFHHLPGRERIGIAADLTACCFAQPVMPFSTASPRFLGRGVAVAITAAELIDLQKRLAVHWAVWLTPQDRQGFNPHVTIQNKVDSVEARALHETLTRDFQAMQGTLVGLDLWHYRGGPWERAGFFPFTGVRLRGSTT